MKNQTIEQYRKNKEVVSSLYDKLDKEQKITGDSQRKISNRYYHLKCKLDKKESEEINIVNENFKWIEAKIKESIAEHSKIINQVKRILLLKKVAKAPSDLSFKVKTYYGEFLELIDETIKTPCLQLRVYVCYNRKPKNKYALVVIGNSIFANNEKLGTFPRTYGLHLNDHGSNIRMHLKDAPEVDKLKEYYSKKIKVLDEFLAQHDGLEKEYRSVQENNNTPEWERLYWEDQKEYYEKHVCQGTERTEYKVILRELAKLE